MQVSRRHHYIPQFLIKNFADEDGLLYLFDKQSGRIAKQRQSPKAIFFEMDRNTVLFNGQPKDHLEALYAALDDKAAADLQNVLLSRKASPEEVVSIVALASSLKWRVPASDAQFGRLKEEVSLADLQAEIRPIDQTQSVDQNALNQLVASNAIKEAKRMLLPLLPLFDEAKLADIHASWFIHSHADERFPSIIGDCPLLEKPNVDYSKLEDFIFPLSSTDTFIYKHGAQKQIKSPLFTIQKDLATLHYSARYVACQSRTHLENTVNMYRVLQAQQQVGQLTKFLFDLIT
ncbi:DUF4238 domain-containing protein [Hymenobacter cheonanensis]|uniref:DUF4238 domain-containing protein n=1 Tax=Hymenobacter sp. CA2-7 TaxID=3063993 RepID=UPI0027141B62|nr:DUF4238 domain-containing protein [Hymenobacter sp. CA2-7]MDO7887697.1 DUF4238 domain-containing protein [Hymenobacter sp. CA2-7]